MKVLKIIFMLIAMPFIGLAMMAVQVALFLMAPFVLLWDMGAQVSAAIRKRRREE